VRRVLLFACETRLPKRVLMPVTGHSIANSPKGHTCTARRALLYNTTSVRPRTPCPISEYPIFRRPTYYQSLTMASYVPI
jgi:hypothetical protein